MRIALLVTLVCISVPVYFAGKNIAFDYHYSLYKDLRLVSSIVMAAIGTWIAILQPNALKTFLKKKVKSDKERDSEDISLFTRSLSVTVFVLILAMVAPFLGLFIKSLYNDESLNIALKGLSFVVIFWSIAGQSYCIIVVLAKSRLLSLHAKIEKKKKSVFKKWLRK